MEDREVPASEIPVDRLLSTMGLSDLILESMDIGVFTVDDDFNILTWNSFLVDYTGMEKKDIIGMNLFEVFSHLKDTGWSERFNQVLETGRTFKVYNSPAFMIPRATPDGQGIFHTIRLYPLFAREDMAKGVCVLLEDVTDRLAMENRMQRILEHSSDAMFVMDPEGKFTYVNQRALMVSNYGKEEMVGRYFYDVLAPESLDAMARGLERLLSGEEVRGLECIFIDGQGDRRDLEINATPITSPGTDDVVAIQGVARDITVRKKREREIRQMKEMSDKILATIPTAVAMMDRHLTIQTVNEAFCNIFLTTEAQTLGRNLVDFLPSDLFVEETEEWVEDVLEKIWRGESHEWRKVNHKNAKGEWMLDIRLVPVPESEGKVLFLMEDVTERARLEEQKRESIRLEAEVEKLKEVDELKTEFISVASHELRTPLTGIWIYLEKLAEGKYCDLTGSHERKISSVMAQVSILSKIVEEMLETSRLEAKLEEMNIRESDLNEIISQSLIKLSSQIENRSIEVVRDLEEDIDPVRMDPDRIERVLINLLSNAINHSPEGGIVRISGTIERGWLRIGIADEGPGVPDGLKSKIFDRFVVADKSLTRKVGGVGLGLSIARGVVDQHGGEIWVEDGEDGGAIFLFRIPVEGPAPDEDEGDEGGQEVGEDP